MSPFLHAASAVALGLVLASSAKAQEAGDASLIGERVRARHCNASGQKSPDGTGPCYRTEGHVLAVTPDILRVEQSKGTVRDVPHAEVQRLERFLGTSRSTGRGALIGGGVGLGLGLALGIGVASEAGGDNVCPFVIGAPLVGAALGALIGAGIGWLPREKWADVSNDQLRVSVVGAGGRVGMALGLAF